MRCPMLGEFMGTLMLVLLGDGAVAGVLLKRSKAEGAGAYGIWPVRRRASSSVPSSRQAVITEAPRVSSDVMARPKGRPSLSTR